MPRAIVALTLAIPGIVLAQQAVPPASTPAQPAIAPASAAPASTPPTAAPVPAATSAASAAATPAQPKKDYGSYAVLKGGWFGSADDYQGDSFSGSSEWELAVGTGRIVGIELGAGYMSTSAGGLEVDTIPLLLTLRLQIPIAMFAPHLDLGAGLYFNQATVGGRELSDWTAGWHAGLGLDLLLGRLLLGLDARYMGVSPTFSTVGELTLDRYAVLLKAGVRF